MFCRLWRAPVWAALLMFIAGSAAAAGGRLDAAQPAGTDVLSVHQDGVQFRAFAVDPKKDFDTSVLPAVEGLARLQRAYDLLMQNSAFSATQIARLKRHGDIIIEYVPDDLGDAYAQYERIAVFTPDTRHRNDGAAPRFHVTVGRHGIKWPTAELAAVLAHELVGHGMQQHRGKLTKTRQIDLECEARLFQYLALQDLGIDGNNRDVNAFRKSVETYWCADFVAFSRREGLSAAADWERGAPDILRLVDAFALYLKHNEDTGITASALRTAGRLQKKSGAAGVPRLSSTRLRH